MPAPADGTHTYVLLFYGRHDLTEWDVGPIFHDALGEQQGIVATEAFTSLIENQEIEAFTPVT